MTSILYQAVWIDLIVVVNLVSSCCGMHERRPPIIVLLFKNISHPTLLVLLSRGHNITFYGSLCQGEVTQGLTCLSECRLIYTTDKGKKRGGGGL